MESVFECSFIMDYKYSKEFTKYQIFKKPILAVIYIILFIDLLYYIVNSIIYNYIDNFIYFILTFYIFVFLVYFLMLRNVKKRYNTYLNNSEITTNYSFFDDCVLISSSSDTANSNSKYFYKDFVKIKQTKNLILIKIKANMYIIIPKNSFIKGSMDDFIKYFNNKLKK